MNDELLRIGYGLDRLPWQDPDRDQLDVWTVSLQLGEPAEASEDELRWLPLASAALYGIDIDRCLGVGQSPFEVADAHSADAAYYYEHVFEVNGELLADVEDQFEWPPGRPLFVHDVQVQPKLRRKGMSERAGRTAVVLGVPVEICPGDAEHAGRSRVSA